MTDINDEPAEVPEVECPECGTTIRAYLGDQVVIAELRAQGWRPPAKQDEALELDLVDTIAERLRPFQLRLGENTAGFIRDGRRTVHLSGGERRDLAMELAVLVADLAELRRGAAAGPAGGLPAEGVCRPVQLDVAGEELVVAAHGREPMTELDRAHFAEVVAAAQRAVAAQHPNVGVVQELLAAARLARWCIPDGQVGRVGQHDGAAVRDRLAVAVRAAREALTNGGGNVDIP